MSGGDQARGRRGEGERERARERTGGGCKEINKLRRQSDRRTDGQRERDDETISVGFERGSPEAACAERRYAESVEGRGSNDSVAS